MSSEFYNLYNSYGQQELFEVLLNPTDYQPEAMECAMQVLIEKKRVEDYQKISDSKKAEQEKESEQQEQDTIEKAEYYRKAVQIKMQRYSYSVLLSDTSKFEAKLAELNIEYFIEGQTDVLQLSATSSQTYYFKKEDTDTVDRVYKELGISSNSFNVQKAEFNMQIKLIGVIVFGILLVYGLYYLFTKQ